MDDIMTKLSQFEIPIRNRKYLDRVLNNKYMNQNLKRNVDNFLNAPKLTSTLSSEFEKIQKDLGKLNDIIVELSGSSLPLSKGGEEDLDILLSRGQLWVSQAVKKIIGRQNQCHGNTAELYDINKKEVPGLYIATGYAIGEDGAWRQHSWLLLKKPKSTTIIETTKPKRLAYYGVILTEKEADRFVYYNL